MLKTDEQARTFWKRAVGRGLLRCLARSVEGASSRSTAFTIRHTAILKVPKLAARTAGFRVVARVTASGRKTPVYYDMIVLGQGRAVTEISFAQLGSKIPATAEIALAQTVARHLGTSLAA